MKKLLLLLTLLSLCVASRAGSLVTATITVTNTPGDGDTIIVNGSTRTWKTSVATPSSQILIGASIGANATNLFNQFAGTAFTTLSLNRSGTNGVTLRGIIDQTIAVTIAGTWGEYSLSTNTTAEASVVSTPFSSYPTQSKATNIASQLALDFGTYSTNALAAGSTLLSRVIQTTGTQTASGDKSWFGVTTLNNAANAIIGGTLTNVTGGFTNIYATNIYIYGALNITNTAPYIYFKDTDAAADEKTFFVFAAGGEMAFAVSDDSGGFSSVFLSIVRTGTTIDNMALLEGELQITDGIQNTGTTKFSRMNHTALANGNNAGVDFGVSTFVKIKAGPTGAFAICGIANGADGKVYTLYNATGQNMTISNDSGVDPTASNRIYTGTGADIATTANGVVTLIYDSEDSRWIVVSIRD